MFKKREDKNKEVYAVRHHDGSLCTQKQLETAVETAGVQDSINTRSCCDGQGFMC